MEERKEWREGDKCGRKIMKRQNENGDEKGGKKEPKE